MKRVLFSAEPNAEHIPSMHKNTHTGVEGGMLSNMVNKTRLETWI